MSEAKTPTPAPGQAPQDVMAALVSALSRLSDKESYSDNEARMAGVVDRWRDAMNATPDNRGPKQWSQHFAFFSQLADMVIDGHQDMLGGIGAKCKARDAWKKVEQAAKRWISADPANELVDNRVLNYARRAYQDFPGCPTMPMATNIPTFMAYICSEVAFNNEQARLKLSNELQKLSLNNSETIPEFIARVGDLAARINQAEVKWSDHHTRHEELAAST